MWQKVYDYVIFSVEIHVNHPSHANGFIHLTMSFYMQIPTLRVVHKIPKYKSYENMCFLSIHVT